MTTFRAAPAVAAIGRKLIDTVHTGLTDIRVEYVFRDPPATSKGRVRLGSARKVTGLAAYLAGESTEVASDEGEPFFVIEIAETEWANLDAKQRKALVDHELCHCRYDFDETKNEVKLSIVGHDLEEFVAVVDRHGLWRPDVEVFAASTSKFKQLELGEEGGAS